MTAPTGGASTPPGWYPDPQSPSLRWWNGQQWTDQWAPPSSTRPVVSTPPAAPVRPAPGRGVPQQSLPRKRSPLPWIAAIVVVVGVIGFAMTSGSGESNKASSATELPTDPQQLAATLEVVDDATLSDPNTYHRVDDAEFKKVMYPSGDLKTYPYPHVGSRVIIYGRVDNIAPNPQDPSAATFFDATTSNTDLGPVVGLSSKSQDVPIIGLKSAVGEIKPGDNLEIFVEVRRPFLTGKEVFGSQLRDPFLVAHIVNVLR